MKLNVGNADRIIRVLLALVFVVLYLTNVVTGIFGIVLLALALIFVVTALLGICPIYLALKLSTRKKEKAA